MGRFASTVPFYERTRQPYGLPFFTSVAHRLGFTRSMRLIDLGTGPGLLAVGFAPFVGMAIGVDPEPGMLAAARLNAEAAGVALALIESRTEELPDDIGTFDVVTIGRALHWMEPDATRATLDRVVAADGMVLICGSKTVADDRNPWRPAYEALRRRWTNDPGRVSYDDHDTVFTGSRFVLSQTIAVEATHSIPVEALCERVLSMSSTSPERIGGDTDLLRQEFRALLAPFAEGERIAETVEARAAVYTARVDITP